MRCKSDFWSLLFTGVRSAYPFAAFPDVHEGSVRIVSVEDLATGTLQVIESPTLDFDQSGYFNREVHKRVDINQSNCEPDVVDEILFLSEVLETNWVDIFVEDESGLGSPVHGDETHVMEVGRISTLRRPTCQSSETSKLCCEGRLV